MVGDTAIAPFVFRLEVTYLACHKVPEKLEEEMERERNLYLRCGFPLFLSSTSFWDFVTCRRVL